MELHIVNLNLKFHYIFSEVPNEFHWANISANLEVYIVRGSGSVDMLL